MQAICFEHFGIGSKHQGVSVVILCDEPLNQTIA